MERIIRELTPALEADFFRFFEELAFPEHPEWGAGCYCCFFHAESEKVWFARKPEENRMIAQLMICTGAMHGLLAYEGGDPVGWCHFDAKANLPGLRAFYPKAAEGETEGVGSIVCFTIAQPYRGRGVATDLLREACHLLQKRGFAFAEGYPLPENGKTATSEEQYHGPLTLFEKQEFTVFRKLGELTVVRKALNEQGRGGKQL